MDWKPLSLGFVLTSMLLQCRMDPMHTCAWMARSSRSHGRALRRRLNWQLHFGEPPKWAPGVRFVLVDPEPSERDAGIAAVTLRGASLTLLTQRRRLASFFNLICSESTSQPHMLHRRMAVLQTCNYVHSLKHPFMDVSSH